jgi:hypothetical protein
MELKRRDALAGTEMVYSPFAPVTVPFVVPSMTTPAAIIGSPDSSDTVPFTVMFWASAAKPESRMAADARKSLNFLISHLIN